MDTFPATAPKSPGRLHALWTTLVHDRHFTTVLVAWLICSLLQVLYLKKYSAALPHCDEWTMTSVAAGDRPLTLGELWTPTNEHRMPLNRLSMFALGRLGGWDMRLIRMTNLAMLSLGCLALVLAVRRIRGESALSDVFLCLLVLTPGQWESTLLYAYSLIPALSAFCFALALLMVKQPLRSVPALWLYLSAALVVTLSGGPSGNVWALGLCGALAPSLWAPASIAWKRSAVTGTAIVAAVSLVFLALTPQVARHAPYQSDSMLLTLRAAAKVIVCWLGPAGRAAWPWTLLVLAVPAIVIATAIFTRWLKRKAIDDAARTAAWLDLAVVVAATLVLGLLIAHGRSRLDVWSSRYHTLMLPLGVLTYLLLVRLQTSVLVPNLLALGMAVCVGWMSTEAIEMGKSRFANLDSAVRELKRSQDPLTLLAIRHAKTLACLRCLQVHEGGSVDANVAFAEEPALCQKYLLELRNKNLSVFKRYTGPKIELSECWSGEWEAESGTLGPGLRVVQDSEAMSTKAIEVATVEGGAAQASFAVEVPRPGYYLLCSRLRADPSTPPVHLTIDNHAEFDCPLLTAGHYHPSCIGPPLLLSPGKHTLTLTFPGPGARLDSLELMAWIP